MTHSYDNTLLQRMGFSDPDRKTPAHDAACIEIATDPERFVRAFKELRFLRNAKCELEVPLQKGDGKYASTVGFIDAMLTYETGQEHSKINQPSAACKSGLSGEDCARRIEQADLEIAKCSAGNYPHKDNSLYAMMNDAWVEWTSDRESVERRLAKSNGREFTNPPMRNGFELNYDYLSTETAAKGKHAGCAPYVEVGVETCMSWSPRCVLVEVKTKIDNLGSLLRQMNLYREYKQHHGHDRIHGCQLGISDYVIWSLDPDDTRFSKLLAQQGYTLIAGPLP